MELKNIIDELNKKIDQQRFRWDSQQKELEAKIELNTQLLEEKNNEVRIYFN